MVKKVISLACIGFLNPLYLGAWGMRGHTVANLTLFPVLRLPVASIEAFSTFPGPAPTGTDITPGQSLSGFEFIFETTLGDIRFTNPTPPRRDV